METNNFVAVRSNTEALIKEVSATMNYWKNVADRQSREIERLNKLLSEKEEEYKDRKIRELESENEMLKDTLDTSYFITRQEEDRMNKWKEEHEKIHGIYDFKDRLKAGGSIGGRYSYTFYPTSIGTVGTVKCGICGDEFIFKDI